MNNKEYKVENGITRCRFLYFDPLSVAQGATPLPKGEAKAVDS